MHKVNVLFALSPTICLKPERIVFYLLGPPLPKRLFGFSMLEIHGNLFVFGGNDRLKIGGSQSAIYQLSCYSGDCIWSTINQTLKIARWYLVAISVPDYFCF